MLSYQVQVAVFRSLAVAIKLSLRMMYFLKIRYVIQKMRESLHCAIAEKTEKSQFDNFQQFESIIY